MPFILLTNEKAHRLNGVTNPLFIIIGNGNPVLIKTT